MGAGEGGQKSLPPPSAVCDFNVNATLSRARQRPLWTCRLVRVILVVVAVVATKTSISKISCNKNS